MCVCVLGCKFVVTYLSLKTRQNLYIVDKLIRNFQRCEDLSNFLHRCEELVRVIHIFCECNEFGVMLHNYLHV